MENSQVSGQAITASIMLGRKNEPHPLFASDSLQFAFETTGTGITARDQHIFPLNLVLKYSVNYTNFYS
jgi:hypothetical protein